MKEILFKKKNVVVVREKETPPLGKGNVRVKHIYSLVSAGTECLKLQGWLGKVDNKKVGYSGVGQVIGGTEGTRFNIGDFVFTRQRHVDIVDIPKDIAEKQFVLVSKELAKQATFLELGKVAMHGIHRVDIELGNWIVVFGLGIVGNLSAQLASLTASGKVIGVEPIASRRKIAEEMGIRTLNPTRDDFINMVMEITGGADIILETSGSPQALNQAMKIAAPRGQISVIAGHYGKRELDMKTDFQNKELSLIGARRLEITEKSMADRWTVMECKKEIFHMIEKGNIQVGPLITHCVNPDKAPEIYTKLIEKDETMLGVIFNWEGEE